MTLFTVNEESFVIWFLFIRIEYREDENFLRLSRVIEFQTSVFIYIHFLYEWYISELVVEYIHGFRV